MPFIANTLVSASTEEKTSANLRTCRQCGNVSVPRMAAAVPHCFHCGSSYDTTGKNEARFPKQGYDVVKVNNKSFEFKP